MNEKTPYAKDSVEKTVRDIDLTPITKPPVRWEPKLYSHAACSANCCGVSLPSELCGLTSL